MQAPDLGGAQGLASDFKHGAPQADRGSVFHGEAHRLGGGTEAARALGQRGGDVATKEKLTWRVENMGIHMFLSYRKFGASPGAARP